MGLYGLIWLCMSLCGSIWVDAALYAFMRSFKLANSVWAARCFSDFKRMLWDFFQDGRCNIGL